MEEVLTAREIEQMLEKHSNWVYGTGDDADRADLVNVTLSNFSFTGYKQGFRGARLHNVNMGYQTSLTRSDFTRAMITVSNFSHCNLAASKFREAVLNGTDFHNANLESADFSFAKLKSVDFTGANLKNAKFKGADLEDAILEGAVLNNADFSNAKHVPYIFMICPEEGNFIGWKKGVDFFTAEPVLIKLEIPEDADRTSGTDRVCRASKAKVLEITGLINFGQYQEARSKHDSTFRYRVGAEVQVNAFSSGDRFLKNAPGIYFFMNKREALLY